MSIKTKKIWQGEYETVGLSNTYTVRLSEEAFDKWTTWMVLGRGDDIFYAESKKACLEIIEQFENGTWS
jgi:hypothetical protein